MMQPSNKLSVLYLASLACVTITGAAGLLLFTRPRETGLLTGADLFIMTVAAVALIALLFIYLEIDSIRSTQISIAANAKLFDDVRIHVNAAYTYPSSDFLEPADGEKLVAVDVSWRGPTDKIELNRISMIDADTEDRARDECPIGPDSEFVFLDPASGQPIEHVPYRIPPEFRVLFLFIAPSEMRTLKLMFWGYEITPQPVRILEQAPANAPRPTVDDFREFNKVRDNMPDIDGAYDESANLAGRFNVISAYRYNGLHFCPADPDEKTIAIDLCIQGMNKDVLIDRMQILDPETGELADFNKTLLNYVFLDAESGQVCDSGLGWLTPFVRMLFIYNIPAKMDSIVIALLGYIMTPEAVAVQAGEPSDAPRPTEADFKKSHEALEQLLSRENPRSPNIVTMP